MNLHRFKAKDDFYEQNFENNRQVLKELLERKIGEVKSRIDSSCTTIVVHNRDRLEILRKS